MIYRGSGGQTSQSRSSIERGANDGNNDNNKREKKTSSRQAIAIRECLGVDIVEELLSKLNNKNNAK